MKNEKDYLIGAAIVVGIDYWPLLGMIASCSTLDLAMLGWIAYIKSMDLEFKYIVGKDNLVANMLLCANMKMKERIIDREEDVGTNFYSTSLTRRKGLCLSTPLEPFTKESYKGEWLHIGRYLSTLQRQEG